MPSNRSTIGQGAGAVLVNQTNINKDRPFFLPVGTPATEQIADENLFVSSVTFNPTGTLSTGMIGILASSTISGALGTTSSLNFATASGVGFGLAVSSLALAEGSAGRAASISLAQDRQIKITADNISIDLLSTSQLNASSINGFPVNANTSYAVFANGLPVQLTAGGTSTIVMPNIFPLGFNVVATPAGPAFPGTDIYTSNYTSNSFRINGDANGRANYIASGRQQ
jgi:hypothetical protein